MPSREKRLCKQATVKKAISVLLSFNSVNLGTLLSFTRFSENPITRFFFTQLFFGQSRVLLLYQVSQKTELPPQLTTSRLNLPQFAISDIIAHVTIGLAIWGFP